MPALMHRLVRWLARRALRWFYGDIELLNQQAIPASGPTLLIANHSNDLPDILMTFLTTGRDIRFVANIAAADWRLVQWVYTGLGVIPVSRIRDARALKARGEDAVALNRQAFARVTDALQAGHAVAIFPEGIVPDLPELAPLRAGAARMAIDALARGITPLTLVPIGYQYECPDAPRSGFLTVVGTPLSLDEWHPVHADKAVRELTSCMTELLQSVTRNASTQRAAEHLNQTVAAVGAALSSATLSPMAAAHTVHQLLTRHAESSDALGPLEQRAATLAAALAAFTRRAWSARDSALVLGAAGDPHASWSAPSVLRLLAMAPVAALGWLWHGVPFRVAYALAGRLAPRRAEFAARAMVPGLYIMACWYVLMPLLLLFTGLSPWIVLLFFVAQPRLGDAALRWRDDFRARQLILRVRRAPATERQALLVGAEQVRHAWHALQETLDPQAVLPLRHVHAPVPHNRSTNTPAGPLPGGGIA